MGDPPPPRSNFFQFCAVFRETWQSRILAPPGLLAPRPWSIGTPWRVGAPWSIGTPWRVCAPSYG